MTLLDHNHAREDPKKPGAEAFNSSRVASQVRNECLTHPATILPASVSAVSLFWTVLIAASPASVGITIGGVFVATSALIWNYIVNGEKRVQAHYAKLMVEKRESLQLQCLDYVVRANREGFEKAGKAGRELAKVYADLMAYLKERKSGRSLDTFSLMAESAFEQGVSVLERALSVYQAMRTVDVAALEAQVAELEKELGSLVEQDEKDLQQRQIDAHKKQVSFYHKKEKQLKELLTLVDEIESALQTTYLGLLELGSEDPTAFLSEDGDAANQLVSAFEAAKRVEARLKGSDDEASRARMQEYIKAADSQ
jgi:hypothetical protein